MKIRESSSSVWGKTFAATGGTLLFLLTLITWAGSGTRTLQETEIALTLNLVTFLPVAATLVPKIKNRIRAAIILAAPLILYLGAGYLYLTQTEPLTINFSNLISLLILLIPADLVIVGGVMVILSR